MAFPGVGLYEKGVKLVGLVDTGCEVTIIQGNKIGLNAEGICKRDPNPTELYGIHGKKCMVMGKQMVGLKMGQGKVVAHICSISQTSPGGCDVVLGMDFLRRFSRIKTQGVTIFPWDTRLEQGAFGEGVSGAIGANKKKHPICIDDKDFFGIFDGAKWVIQWKWKNGTVKLTNSIGQYKSTSRVDFAKDFNREVQEWINKGWLREVKLNEYSHILATMHPQKGKVRPVLDFRELNQYVSCHSGDEIAICDESIRRWRKLGEKVKVVDLKSAYLQLHVVESLWPYQQVEFGGRRYVLT